MGRLGHGGRLDGLARVGVAALLVDGLGRAENGLRVDRDAPGRVVDLVDAHHPVGQLEHLGAERDDDELGVLRPLL